MEENKLPTPPSAEEIAAGRRHSLLVGLGLIGGLALLFGLTALIWS
jgi:hypothetical protein